MKSKLQKITNKSKKAIKKYKDWNPPKALVFLIISIIIINFSCNKFKLDNDFWFIINAGRDIINNGFSNIEHFTIHSNLYYIQQQWLTDIIFYYIYNKFSIVGMYILLNIINIISTLLIYKICILLSNNRIKLSLFITAFTSHLLGVSFLVTRPQIFDITLILIELYLLELYIRKNNKKYLLGLPIISLLFINFHASTWLMTLVIIIPYLLGRINLKIFTKTDYKIKPILITIVIMILIALINPYGIKSLVYLFNSYGIEEINNLVAEMKPITINNASIIYVYIFIILISYYVNKENKINLCYLLLFLGTTYLALSHLRGIIFLLIAGIFSLSHNFKNKKDIIEKKEPFLSRYKIVNISYLIFASFTIFSFIHNIENRFINEKEMALYEVADFLDKNIDSNSTIYTSYDDGSYIEYRGYKCYIDPRAEVFLKKINKKEDIFIEYYNLQSGNINYHDFLNKYNFDYLLLNSEIDILISYIDDCSNYKLIYETYDKETKITYKLYQRFNNE